MGASQSAPNPSPEQNLLLRDLGGPTKVSRLIKVRTGLTVSRQAVSNWFQRGIPFRYRAPLAIEAREQGVGVPAGFLGEQPPAAILDEVPFL